MIQYDNEDSDEFQFTPFDQAKIEDLEIGEKMEGESGHFVVVHDQNKYCIWIVKDDLKSGIIQPTAEKVIQFLQSQ